MFKRALLANALILALSTPTFSSEQDIEAITVTGHFHRITLDQLSASATVISEARLQSRQAEHLDSLLNIAPNVNFTAGASRGRFVQIRGIGERSLFAEPLNPSVSFLVDDFDFSGLAAAGVLFDTEQVEIYRGPQSTLFGSGALAGAIKISSQAPVDISSGRAEVRVASQDTYRVELAQGGALTNSLNYRAAVLHHRSDGFIDNQFLGRDNTNNINESAASLRFAWQAAEHTQVSLNYRWYDIDNGYDAFSLDNTRETLSDQPGFDRHQTHAVSLKSQTQFAWANMDIILTHAAHRIAYAYDEDWTFDGFHPFGYTSFDLYQRDIDMQTAELRFTSANDSLNDRQQMKWVTGVLYRRNEQQLARDYTFSDSLFSSRYQPDNLALYAQSEWPLAQNLNLLVGARVESFAFDYTDSAGVDASTRTTMTGGQLALQYWQDTSFFYASVGRGFKAPGVNPDERVTPMRRFFDAEFNWNYELGYKGRLFHPDITTRIALFHMDRENTQVNDFDVQRRADGTADFIDIIGNANLGTNRGAEIELAFAATDRWQLNASLGVLDATFEQYQRADGSVVERQRQAQAPRHMANLFSVYELTDAWAWQLDMDYKGRHRFSDGHEVENPSFVLVNTQLNWQQENWQASVWIRNLFDRTFFVRGFGGFSNDPRDEYAFDEPYFQLGDGRQFGLTLSYQF